MEALQSAEKALQTRTASALPAQDLRVSQNNHYLWPASLCYTLLHQIFKYTFKAVYNER